MKVLNLRCGAEHGFEGWFASQDDYEQQHARGLVQCPVCGDATVHRLPSAPRINMNRGCAPEAAVPASTPSAGTSPGPAGVVRSSPEAAHWLHAMRQALSRIDDVGDRFPEEARRIHYGETDERAIRGQATPDEAASLRDEGIEVMSLALPAALKEPLQ